MPETATTSRPSPDRSHAISESSAESARPAGAPRPAGPTPAFERVLDEAEDPRRDRARRVGVAAVVYAIGGASAGAASTTDYLTSAATTGDVTDDVAATGTLEPQAQYGLVFGADPYLVSDGCHRARRSTTTWPVKEVEVAVGDTVAEGDVLATAEHDESPARSRRRPERPRLRRA